MEEFQNIIQEFNNKTTLEKDDILHYRQILSNEVKDTDWIHVKSSKTYKLEDITINATNGFENQLQVLYSNNERDKFVREINEFCQKFRRGEVL